MPNLKSLIAQVTLTWTVPETEEVDDENVEEVEEKLKNAIESALGISEVEVQDIYDSESRD